MDFNAFFLLILLNFWFFLLDASQIVVRLLGILFDIHGTQM